MLKLTIEDVQDMFPNAESADVYAFHEFAYQFFGNNKDTDDRFQNMLDHFKEDEKTEADTEDTRSYNVGASNYSDHKIQPWDIWIDWKLNPFDADIIKRTLRDKKSDDRQMDYEKIVHICKERIRQLKTGIQI